MDRMLRRATPILLLLLGVLALAEPALPAALRDALGSFGFLRLTVAILCVYMVLVIAERERMARDFQEVLRAFRDFHKQASGSAGDPTAPRSGEPNEAQKHEALQILISALASPDAGVRSKAHAHLRRITGQDLPADPGAWNAWLARS